MPGPLRTGGVPENLNMWGLYMNAYEVHCRYWRDSV
jgi:hypothetical protein